MNNQEFTIMYSLNKSSEKTKNKIFRYNVNFVSIISPLSFKKNIFTDTHRKNLTKNNNKAFFKKSYTILTWFYYLTFVNLKKNKNNNIRVFVKPKIRKIFTHTKAPMAHKNNSKEQYKFLFYSYTISFNNKKNSDNISINNNIFNNFLFLWTTKKKLFFLETNTLFLKSYCFFSSYTDSYFFKFK